MNQTVLNISRIYPALSKYIGPNIYAECHTPTSLTDLASKWVKRDICGILRTSRLLIKEIHWSSIVLQTSEIWHEHWKSNFICPFCWSFDVKGSMSNCSCNYLLTIYLPFWDYTLCAHAIPADIDMYPELVALLIIPYQRCWSLRITEAWHVRLSPASSDESPVPQVVC